MNRINSLKRPGTPLGSLRFASAGLACLTILASSAAHAQRPTGPIAPSPAPISVSVDFLGFPNLIWGNRSSYEFIRPIPERITVDALGIDDEVDVIAYDPATEVVVREQFTNDRMHLSEQVTSPV